jgi:carboxymethylenebutenolidase
MCDDDIHQGLVSDPTLSRRSFSALTVAAAAGVATGAHAAALVERDGTGKTEGGTADAVLVQPEGKGPWPAVLIWPDILGLRPVFREMSRRLAAEGYAVLTPNPFYRVKAAPIIDGPFDFASPADREKLVPFRASITPEGVARDSAAFLAFLDALPQVDKAKKAGVQGYCMGGSLAMRTAAAVPARIGAGASFHGGSLATDAPDSPHLLVPKIKAAFLFAVGRNDDQKDPGEKDRVKAAFDAAKLPAKVEVYAADHGWCVKGSAAYNEAEAERAWAELLALYKRRLV